MATDIFGNKIKKSNMGLNLKSSVLGGSTLAFGSSKKETERDTRRAFSPTQKKQLLYQQDNKCGRCHKTLDPREIEYDHKKPWAAKGRTIVENGRALCGSCHKIVTHEYRLKQINKKRKPKDENPFGGSLNLGLNTKKNPWGY